MKTFQKMLRVNGNRYPQRTNQVCVDGSFKPFLIPLLDKRTLAWIKLKKDYVTTLGDSLDLIPIGAWHGNGRKARWWSPVLLAIYDRKLGKPVAVCKCMSGTKPILSPQNI